jgi:hypothetical protein
MIPMSKNVQAFDDMSAAEGSIRDVLAGKSPGEAMTAILSLYQAMPEEKRAALVAVLATQVAVASRDRSLA